MDKLIVNQLYYFGDVNPEHGGVICRKLENGSIEAFEIGEYSPINFCHFIGYLYVEKEYNDLESLQDDYFNDEVFRDGCEPVFKFMKAIDWEYTNESNKDCIDKFVRCDYNVWNLIKRYIGVPLNTKIIGA